MKRTPFSQCKSLLFASLLTLTTFAGCDDDSSESVAVEEVVTTNAKIAYAVFSDSVVTAEALQLAVDAFVADPTQPKMDAAKAAWKAAREPYGQTEVYRFGNANVDDWEGSVNAWPLGEAMIDYVATNIDGDSGPDSTAPSANGNIIADTTIDVTSPSVIGGLNEDNDDERNVSAGYHAVEFLLWGQDLNDQDATWDGTAIRDTTPGQRPLSDFFTTADECTTGADHATQADPTVCVRRGDYLKAVTQLLVDDLKIMVVDWDPAGTGNYYQTFVAGGDASLAKMMAGMGRLSFGELAGERINIARLQNSQEDEHSCFSDNTHRDIVLNAKGVQNTYLGTYTSSAGVTTKGPGLYDFLLGAGHSDIAEKLKENLEATSTAADAVDAKAKSGNPFDNQIQENDNTDVKAVVTALINQATRDTEGSISKAAEVLGINIDDLEQDTEEPL
ncbi:MAG: iron-regulated protein [Kofleriaceae bacterium]|nr:iron-regulated protein [Kofleriaceae bacterium]